MLTVEQLIQQLQQMPPKAKVTVYGAVSPYLGATTVTVVDTNLKGVKRETDTDEYIYLTI